LLGLLALGLLLVAISWLIDRRRWNKGCCRTCGGQWRRFDTDSIGARGYHCGWCQDVAAIGFEIDACLRGEGGAIGCANDARRRAPG
jgi:hypothetical protein